VRVIDLLVVRKDSLGNVMTTTASDLDFEEATEFGSYVGSLAGYKSGGEEGMDYGAIAGAAELADGHVFDEGDVFRVTQSLPNDTSAALVLIEHRWAKSLLASVERAGGLELSNDWLHHDDVLTITPPVEQPD
jgi:hypothetical protein